MVRWRATATHRRVRVWVGSDLVVDLPASAPSPAALSQVLLGEGFSRVEVVAMTDQVGTTCWAWGLAEMEME